MFATAHASPCSARDRPRPVELSAGRSGTGSSAQESFDQRGRLDSGNVDPVVRIDHTVLGTEVGPFTNNPGLVMHDFQKNRAAWSTGSCWVWLCVGLVFSAPLAAQIEEAERVAQSTRVLAEIMDAPDAAIPGAVLEGAEAIAVFPSTLKAGFIFGGHRGR